MAPLAAVGGYSELEPSAVHLRRGRARIIDVREADELQGELGRIAEAEHVPLATVERASGAWDPSAEVVLVCRSGNRSRQAAQLLVRAGFTSVVNMSGGMMGWNAAGLPLAAR